MIRGFRLNSFMSVGLTSILLVTLFQNYTHRTDSEKDINISINHSEKLPTTNVPKELHSLHPEQQAPRATNPPKVGIAYMIWHCMANNPLRNKVISRARVTGDWGVIPDFHWRDTPALTNGIESYCTTNKSLVEKHFEMLEAAKIDFLVVDFTNQSNTPESEDEAAPQSMIDSFQNLLDVSAERGGKIKIVPWVSFKGNLHRHLLKMMGVLSLNNPTPYENTWFKYQGKPLIIASWDKARGQHNVEPAIAAVEAAGVTVKKMWGLHNGKLQDASGNTVWSFMEQCRPGFRESKGTTDCGQYTHPEMASVSAAYQETYMTDFRTSVPKFYGRTFLKQLKTAQENNAPLVILNTWNEWIAQRFCLENGAPTHLCYDKNGSPIKNHFPFDGRPVFVDAFDREYSRDLEPDTLGDEYYQLMIKAIAQFKTTP